MPRAKTDDKRDPLSTELVCYPGDGLDGTDEQFRRRQLWDTQRAAVEAEREACAPNEQ